MTTRPYLLDSLYIVGREMKNNAIFNTNIREFVNVADKHYKPVDVAITIERFIQSDEKNI